MKYRVTSQERGHARLEALDGSGVGGIVGLPVDLRPGQVVEVDRIGKVGCRVDVDGSAFRWAENGSWRKLTLCGRLATWGEAG